MGQFAVAGATSWGLTLASFLARNGHDVDLLCRSEPEAVEIDRRRGIRRLSELVLPPNVHPRAGADDTSYDGLIFATPAQRLREAAVSLARLSRVPALSGAKGIEHGSRLRMTEVLTSCGWAVQLVAALSGPNLAHEIVAGLPAAAVIASSDAGRACLWQEALATPTFRLYRADDVVGIELAGALKNVVAIAAGACAGLGLGANAMAALITRGLAETTRLGVALGAQPLTFLGLAGVGDLFASCMSPLSRNHRLGVLLAQGKSFREALATIGETVEGAETAPVALEMARKAGIEMPITEQVCAVLRGAADVRAAMSTLLARAATAEPVQPPQLRAKPPTPTD